MVASAIAELGLQPGARVTRVGVTQLPECGTNDEVLAYHGLDVAGLVKAIGAVAGQTNTEHGTRSNPELGTRNRELV